MEGLAAEGDESEPPDTAGAELTRRLPALASALEAADRVRAERGGGRAEGEGGEMWRERGESRE